MEQLMKFTNDQFNDKHNHQFSVCIKIERKQVKTYKENKAVKIRNKSYDWC